MAFRCIPPEFNHWDHPGFYALASAGCSIGLERLGLVSVWRQTFSQTEVYLY